MAKEYTNGEITILWKKEKCIHAAECVKALPKVYDPKGRPWIKIENASSEELKNQVAKCPSGALSYFINDQKEKDTNSTETKIEVRENGPLIVFGDLVVSNKDGGSETKNNRTAFCRCGHSQNKPFCDGAHAKFGFIG